jgi:hypothetical protein
MINAHCAGAVYIHYWPDSILLCPLITQVESFFASSVSLPLIPTPTAVATTLPHGRLNCNRIIRSPSLNTSLETHVSEWEGRGLPLARNSF